ncbi:penicillin acylase family protein [Granulicella sp. dw_53]|uniref:penicillin acylase family protein n=1 Tax=Granulicella sp. dw_53 TaxID=2719792 RepID=UPI001BD50977
MRLRLIASAVFATVAFSSLIVPSLHAAPAYRPAKGTDILWDKYGIPHIYAKSTPDLFFCYGYAQAEAHGNLLLHLYGEARGRSAEYFGSPNTPEAKAETSSAIKSDTWVWTNSIPQRSEGWLKQQTPEFRSYLEAFAAGINAYAAKHPEAISEESKRVLPVTALDPIVRSQHFIHFTFVASSRLAEPTRRAAVSTEASLEPGPLDEIPGVPADSDGGSNGWAIAPSHSASGKSMLLSNPHLAWAGSTTYFEAEFNAPGIHIYGATQVGLPVLRFAFNDFLGYTHTVNTIDAADLYRIKTSGEGYLFDGKVLPFEKDSHTLKIRQPDGSFTAETLAIRRTVHGPIIKEDAGDPIALRVAGLDKPFMLEQYWQMSTAHDFAHFETAIKRLQAPMYNILYADRDGHIEYLFGGDVPRRSKGDVAFWAGIVPGDTSETLWHDYLTYAELPKVIDPLNGYVQNTNEPPWDAAWPNNLDPKAYPPYVAPTFVSFRTERSLHMLSNLDAGNKPISFDQMIERKFSTRVELADRILPDLLAAAEKYGTPQARQAAAVLAKWDRLTEANSRGAVLFYAWARQFMGPTLASQAGFATPYALASPMTTPAGLKDPAKAAQQLDAAASETMHDFGSLDIPWGDVMRFQINNQSNGQVTGTSVVRTAPIDGVDIPANGGYGNTGVFRVITFGPLQNKTRTPIHGDGYVAAIEFTTPVHAKLSLSYGNSSQPNSSFHTNQIPLLQSKQMREAWLTRKAVEANLSSRETF